MIAGVASLFAIYFGLYAADELVFHRKRGLHPTARWGHPTDLLLLAACAAYTLIVPYGDLTKIPFGILALFALISPLKDERLHAGKTDGSEQLVHAIRYMLQPLVIIMLGGLWPFLLGVNFMVGMMLPFDPESLRPVFGGFAFACVALAIFQFTYWMVLRKDAAPEVPLEEGAAVVKPDAPQTASSKSSVSA